MTTKEVRAKLEGVFDSVSQKDGVFTVRLGFFYTFGKTTEDVENSVRRAFPNAEIVDSGQVWKPFSGGASVARSSHWFVKFRFTPEVKVSFKAELPVRTRFCEGVQQEFGWLPETWHAEVAKIGYAQLGQGTTELLAVTDLKRRLRSECGIQSAILGKSGSFRLEVSS
jgi:hypothetical protein